MLCYQDMKKNVDYSRLSDKALMEMSVGKGKTQWLKLEPESGRLLNRDEVVRLNVEEAETFGHAKEFDKGLKKQSRLMLWISMAIAAAIVWALTAILF